MNPRASDRQIVLSGGARFTILTASLIRLEWSSGQQFEDRASFAFLNRRLPAPKFEVRRKDGWLYLETAKLSLRYKEGSGRFTRENLSVELRQPGSPVVWKPGMKNKGNLLGTTRTLDSISGATALDPGLLSRDGWTLVDDSKTLVFGDSDWPWAVQRADSKATDWYFFGYGRDYKRQLRDFARLSGPVPMPSRFVFGAWWSRYWAYSDQQFKDLVREFREHEVPLDVLVIDMDWHLDGWTGYTWNPKYFPDPDGFMRWANQEGLQTTLNLHPADGVKKHEAAFQSMARALGVDTKATDTIAFDCADRRFVDAYFKYLHHPLEKQGVDFWWIDWQQGKKTRLEGLDPLFWLNYLHWTDMERNSERAGKRPLIMSRWGGLGNHRYPLGFSGDTYCNWESLAFQPYFTSTAGNVGYGYWSHDIGGHQPGPVDPELFARWIQWGAFNPILRTHGTSNAQCERRIWAFPPDVFQAARKAWLLRYSLIPYIYTSARQSFDSGLPLCRPLYYEWPELDEAYENPQEYLFGDQLLVSPAAAPSSPVSGCALARTWIPPGSWTDWFTGREYAGPAMISQLVPLDDIPVFARSGAIIPAGDPMKRASDARLDPLVLHIFPGEKGETEIYEDDGETTGYQRDRCAWTPVSMNRKGKTTKLEIGPTRGDFPGLPEARSFSLILHDVWPPKDVWANGAPVEQDDNASGQAARQSKPKAPVDHLSWIYDGQQLCVIINIPARSIRDTLSIKINAFQNADADSLLRGGLRGRLRSLDRIAAEYKEQTPPEVLEALAIRKELARASSGAESLAQRKIQSQWPGIISAVEKASVSPERRRRAVTQLLGLVCDFKAEGIGGDENKIRAKLDLNFLEPLDNSKAVVRWSAQANWAVEGRNAHRFDGIEANRPISASAVFSPIKQHPQTGAILADVELISGGVKLAFPIEQTLFPSINAWWIAGPFDNPDGIKLDTVFPPEKKIDLNAKYTGKSGRKISWRPCLRSVEKTSQLAGEFRVDLQKFFGAEQENAIAYAVAYVRSPKAQKAVLAVGSDDGVAAWVNGVEVHRHPIGRPYVSKEDKVSILLKEGVNTIFLKISQGTLAWVFGAHIESPEGEIMKGIEVPCEPPNIK